MSNAPREWPNNARDARDCSAEKAVEGIRLLLPIVKGFKDMPDIEKLQRVSLALDNYHTIARKLEQVGACTRPAS